MHQAEGLRIFAATIGDDPVPAYRLKPLSSALAFPLASRLTGSFPERDGLPTDCVLDRCGVLRYVSRRRSIATAWTR